MSKAKTSSFDHCLSSGKKLQTFGVRLVLKDNLNRNWTALGLWISREYFATFNESEVLVKFRLQGGLVRYCVRPVKMITYRKDYVSCLFVDTYDIDNIKLLDRHRTTSNLLWTHHINFRRWDFCAAWVAGFPLPDYGCTCFSDLGMSKLLIFGERRCC